MTETERSLQLFNLGTMSGVYQDSRTSILQRVQLTKSRADAGGQNETRWARVLWFNDPPACLLFLQAVADDAQKSVQWEPEPLLRIDNPLGDDFLERLTRGLEAKGWALHTCGTCAHWRQFENAPNADGVPTGRCGWSHAGQDRLKEEQIEDSVRFQSGLALACEHWSGQGAPAERLPAPAASEHPSLPRYAKKRQEKPGFIGRFKAKLRRETSEAADERARLQPLVEQSGVGAGTQPCFACQGRIANLGAMVGATSEGDQRTFSVWRCRRCHTFYLNEWIDRWQRVNTLETVERYFRLAPLEAIQILRTINDRAEATGKSEREDHDRRRFQVVDDFLTGRQPLSVQEKQGR